MELVRFGDRGVQVSAWARTPTITKEALDAGVREGYFRVSGGHLSIVATNGIATYRVGPEGVSGAGEPPSWKTFPLELLIASGQAPIESPR